MFADAGSQDPVNVLSSVVTQLSPTIPSILHSFRSRYETAKAQQIRIPIGPSHLEEAIIKSCNGMHRVFVLIDAINESACMNSLVSSLQNLARKSSHVYMVVTTTTDAASIHKLCPDHARLVEMDSDYIRKDMEEFVDYRLEHDETLQKLGEMHKDNIRWSLRQGADGS